MALYSLTIVQIRTISYAKAVYVYGTNRLTARDGYTGVPADFHDLVEGYASTGLISGVQCTVGFIGYTIEQFDLALASGWINQQEYDETLALRA